MRTSLLFLLLLPVVFADAAEPWRPFEDASPRMVPKLEELADWCATVKLNRERSEVFEAILAIDPDHRAARRALRYSRDRDGKWVRRGKYRRPRTTKTESRPEFLTRREKLLREFVDEVLAGLVDRRVEVTGPKRQRVLDGLIALLPEDEDIREVRGEVRAESTWILRETAAARKRMPALTKRAREVFASRKEAEDCALDGTDRAIGLVFTAAVRNARVRVTGTVDREEITNAARLVSTGVDFFAETLEPGVLLGSGYRLYLLGDPTAKRAYLQRHPKMTPERRAFLDPLHSGWAPDLDHLGIWADSRSLRLEWVSRQTISLIGLRRYGIQMKHGALHEGLGLYLGYLLTGERRTWFVQQTGYGQGASAAQPKLKDKATDWLAVARSLVEGGERPDYPWLLGLGVNDMKWKELVHAYALGVYLVAGDAPGRGAFLKKVGSGTSPGDASLLTLGHTLPELEQRVLRWLGEL